MNERLPYEEELAKQLEDLHLPDENVAWEDMRRRLEKDKDDDSVIITPPIKGCLGYGLLLLLIATVLFFVFRGDKQTKSPEMKMIDSIERIADHNDLPATSFTQKATGNSSKSGSVKSHKNDTISSIEKDQYDPYLVAVGKINRGNKSFSVKKIIIHKKSKTNSNIQRSDIGSGKKDTTANKKRRIEIKQTGTMKANISTEQDIAASDTITISNSDVKNDTLAKHDISKAHDTLINNSDSLVKTEIKNNNDSAIGKAIIKSKDKSILLLALAYISSYPCRVKN